MPRADANTVLLGAGGLLAAWATTRLLDRLLVDDKDAKAQQPAKETEPTGQPDPHPTTRPRRRTR